MRKLTTLFLCLVALSLQARKLEPWQDPELFEENRLPMRASFTTDQQDVLSLNGIWRFHWSETVASRIKGFEAVSYNDASWKEMPVPGMWELNGFGKPVYVNIGYAWKGLYKNNPPFVPEKGNYVGQYRRAFFLPEEWAGKPVFLCIGAATSNVRVWMNGKPVGYSEDSKLEARFDVSKHLRAGLNVIALEIFRWCDGTYLEDQDCWRLSGIGRDVYLYTREKERLEDIHVSAQADGTLQVQAETTAGVGSLSFILTDAEGHVVSTFGTPVRRGKASAQTRIPDVQPWSAEIPCLYRLQVEARGKRGDVIESTALKIGFRTVEIKGRQLLVNGQPVLIKGADRHELDPYKGSVLSRDDMMRDIRVMKRLNINAVRPSHYPNDPYWLDLCDEYGLYVVDEANVESHGMDFWETSLARDPQYRAAHLVRNQRMAQRDFNHPSIIVWSLGNEAGSGPNFQECYNWLKAYDPSRPVQYEGANRGRDSYSDILCPMYASPDSCERYLNGKDPRPLIQCEYAHAMGNSLGNLKEYWNLVRKYPAYQGGFIWDFADQALWNGKFWAFGGDFDPSQPSDGSFNCNGIVASDRSLHPHAYEVRYQYRSILSSGTPDALAVHNEFFFRDLSDVRLLWTVEADGGAALSGVVDDLAVAPQATTVLNLGLPSLADLPGTLTLCLSYQLKRAWPLLPAGTEIAYDQLLLRDSRPVLLEPDGGNIMFSDGASSLTLSGTRSDGARETVWSVSFSKVKGALTSYMVARQELLSEPLMPCFNRAPTENDLGADFAHRLALWRHPIWEVEKFNVTPLEHSYLVEVQFKPLGGIAAVSVFYQVYADGTVSVVESMADAGGLSSAPDLFRFGMAFSMPGGYDQIEFFGLGPWENYCDRASGALLSRYHQAVADQYHLGYVRTQESGTHTGLREFLILDPTGNGLAVRAAVDFSASALPYSLEQLDVAAPEGDVSEMNHNGQRGIPRHSLELRPSGFTHVHVDALQMGLGSITSWGAEPLEAYHIHPVPREFRFMIMPVMNL